MAPRNCCNEFTRARFLQRSAASAGAGLPAIEAGMPAPAGTGLSRRTFLSRTLGGALAVYGGSKLGIDAFEEGIANAAGDPNRVLVSVFLGGGMDGLSVLAPTGDAQYATLAPDAEDRPRRDARLLRGPQLAVDGRGRVAAHAARRGQGHRDAGDRLRPPQPVALHQPPLLGGRRAQRQRQLRLARPLPRPARRRRQPAAGPVAELLPVARPGRGAGPGRLGLPARPVRALRARRRQPGARADVLAPSAASARCRRPIRRWARRGWWRPRSTRSARRCCPTRATPCRTRPTTGPAASGASWRCWPRCSRPTCRSARSPIDAPGSWDSHSDQANTIGRDVQNVFDTLLAFQRDIEARGIADRVLVHVWTEFGRRPQENAGGTDHGAAGASFLIGTKAAGQMVGEFPGLASLDSAEQPQGHQRLPRRLLLAAGGLVRRRRGSDHPGRGELRAADADRRVAARWSRQRSARLRPCGHEPARSPPRPDRAVGAGRRQARRRR